MRRTRLVNWCFIVIMVAAPLLSACQGAAPAPAPTAAPPTGTAQTGPVVLASPAPAASPSPTPTRAPLPPLVIKTTPDRGEEQDLAAPVVVTFDQPMDPASTGAAFSIEPKVTGEVKVAGAELTFTPAQPLKRAAQYVVNLHESAASAAGLKMGRPVSFKFGTVGYLDVTNTQPGDKTRDVPVDTKITIAFNRPVAPLTGVKEQATLPVPLIITPTLAGKGEWLGTGIYQFTPDAGLAASTDYKVTVMAGLQDTTGALLDKSHTFTFRTTDPAVISWLPDNPANVKVENPISVTFSMPMDAASTEAAFSLVDDKNNRVAGSFTWDKTHSTLGFKPGARLAFGTRYTAAVAATARPANGQGTLRQVARLSFGTAPLPKIIATEPSNGYRSAAPTDAVVFRFAGPMDPSSFISGTYTILPKPAQVYTSYNEYESTFYLNFDKLPLTAYTVTVSGKLADHYGNTLGKDYVLRFTTRDYDPILELNSPGQVGTFNAYTATQAIVTYRNVPTITFSLYRVPITDFIALTGRDNWQRWDKYQPVAANLVRQWTVQTNAARNKTALLRFDLTDADGKQLAPGTYYLGLQSWASGADKAGLRAYRQLLARTDLNVTLKSETESALAWVTDLKSGQPVEGVKVRFTDAYKVDQEATTDKDGVARVAFGKVHRSWDPLVAFANASNGQFGVASNSWEDGINAWSFGLAGGGNMGSDYNGYVYTDRPIYRPGQTVYWKAIVRRDQDALYSIPAPGQQVTVTINDAQGVQLVNKAMTLDPMGTVNGQFSLGNEAALGYYNIALLINTPQVKEGETPSTGVGFQVAEYRKPEYEISARADREEYVQGQQINVTVQAGYYFGGPVKNAKLRWTLLSNDYFFDWQPKGPLSQMRGYYSFSDWDWYDRQNAPSMNGALAQGEGKTDSSGRFTFSAPADITRFAQSQRFTFDVQITDLNNQVVATQAYAVVHKGEFYIGLHPQSYVSTTGEKNRVDVITVNPQSEPAPDTEVTVVANQVTWYNVREQAEDGRYYWNTRAKITPVYTQTLTTDSKGAGVFEWTPQEGGQYKLAATARDQAGHAIRSAAYTWVSGRDYISWRQDNNDRIQLVADKDQYAVGDVAELLVASPYQTPVKALLTVERNHVLSYQVIDLKGNSETLHVPIKAEFAPDVYVSLMLVKGMDSANPAPSFKMGLAQLKVSVADKVLSVALTPQGPGGVAQATSSTAVSNTLRVGPRETVTWTVKTLDAAGQPAKASVSLALVDKALLSLAGDMSGTLLDRFYSQRALGVRTASTLVVNVDRIVAQLSKGGKGGGGGGGGGGIEVRSQFPDIAYWNAVVNTDASGTAVITTTLPDNLTTWTMDARAVTADTLVGQSQVDIIATKDLLVRPALPRFFVERDQAELSAVIHNNTPGALDVTLNLSATGLKLPDQTQSQVHIAAGGAYKAAWPVTVQPGIEQATVRMSATGGGLNDAVQVVLPVYHYTTPEVIGTSGQVALDENRLELVRLPADADPTYGELDVSLEPSLAAGMTGGLTYLEHFPYECVEQTLSRFLPNVVTYEALKKLNVSRPDLDAKLPQQVGVGLQRLYAMQHVDGGWGWWQGDESNAAVTAYAVFGLAKAKAAGFTVDADVLNRGIVYLKSSLKATQNLSNWELNRQAFAVYALAEAGAPEPNRAGALYEVREKLSLYARGYLALALSIINDEAAPERIQTLLASLGGKAISSATATHWEEGWTDYWNMNSDTRTTSIILDVIARLDPQSSLGPNAVRWLMTARKGDRWETTQENAWAIMALTDWMVASGELEGNYSWQVLLNGQTLDQGEVTPANVTQASQLRADIARLLANETNSLLIQRAQGDGQTGQGQLYYTAHLKTYQPVAKLQPLNRGMVVTREYRMAECVSPAQSQPSDPSQPVAAPPAPSAGQNCPTVTQARVGDVISVKLNIVVPATMHYLVVEDPLPAGAEAVDTSLRITSVTAQGPQVQAKPDQSGAQQPAWWNWWWVPSHTELRDEKVALFATSLAPGAYEFTYQIRASVPGVFLTLPPTGYEMYFPEVWGRGAGSTFTVTE